MAANQPEWPRYWLMTDERIGDRLWEAIDRVPADTGGIVFRHYSLSPDERLNLGRKIASLACIKRIKLAVGGSAVLAEVLDAALVHNPTGSSIMPFSCSVHDEPQARAARVAGASLVFISPVFPTRSHPGAASIGVDEACRLAEIAGCPAIALGGMDAIRFQQLEASFHGYAGIDCWLDKPKI